MSLIIAADKDSNDEYHVDEVVFLFLINMSKLQRCDGGFGWCERGKKRSEEDRAAVFSPSIKDGHGVEEEIVRRGSARGQLLQNA
jgi:hypothetical protein